LVLNGAGYRSKYWLSLYVGALYVTKKTSDPESIIEADEKMALQITIISSLITA